jgi:hypothetical protein
MISQNYQKYQEHTYTTFSMKSLLIIEHSGRYNYENKPHFIEEEKIWNVHITFFSSEIQKFKNKICK